jgi:hypothetical protein
MMMFAIALIRAATSPRSVAGARWFMNFAVRALAGSLNMPEAMLMSTCAFAIAYAHAVEQRATPVCPLRLWRQMRKREDLH